MPPDLLGQAHLYARPRHLKPCALPAGWGSMTAIERCPDADYQLTTGRESIIMADRELFSHISENAIGCRRWFQGSVEHRLKIVPRSPILARSIDVEHAGRFDG